MRRLIGFIKELLLIIKRLLMVIIKGIPYCMCVILIYLYTYEKDEKLAILSKRKYRRIKQSIRYKIWVWKHMRWLCKLYHMNYTPLLKYDGNKKILKY